MTTDSQRGNDKAAILGANVDTALASIKNDFDNTFSVEDMPGFAIDSARALIEKAQETLIMSLKSLVILQRELLILPLLQGI